MMGRWQPPDGFVMEAVEEDVRRWYLAEAERDVVGMRRVADRVRQRRTEVGMLYDGDKHLAADAMLGPVEATVQRPWPVVVTEPVDVPARVLTPGTDDETHWQRWWLVYLSVAGVGAWVAVVLWALFTALAALVVTPVMVVVGVVACIALLTLRGGGNGSGGRGFSGTFQGRMR